MKGWRGRCRLPRQLEAENRTEARHSAREYAPQRKRFQVIRFPALFTTGMHGTEHRNQERRTPRLSTPRKPFCRFPDQCFKTRRSLLSFSGPDARNGLSLARNGCSFRSLHSEVNVPGLPLRFQFAASAARSAFLLRYPIRLAPVWAASMLLTRCSFHSLLEKTAPPASTPLGDFYLPPDQSVLLVLLSFGPPSDYARFPIAPRRRFLSLVFRLRINVPGPLRLRRLAVPQTSWNLPHYDPKVFFGQHLSVRNPTVFLSIYFICF
jgi:hypothetical protein